MPNAQAEVAVILGFLLFVFGLLALPTVDRWMILRYCEGASLPVEQCVSMLKQ